MLHRKRNGTRGLLPRLSISLTNVKESFKCNFPVREVARRGIRRGQVSVYEELAVSIIRSLACDPARKSIPDSAGLPR